MESLASEGAVGLQELDLFVHLDIVGAQGASLELKRRLALLERRILRLQCRIRRPEPVALLSNRRHHRIRRGIPGRRRAAWQLQRLRRGCVLSIPSALLGGVVGLKQCREMHRRKPARVLWRVFLVELLL